MGDFRKPLKGMVYRLGALYPASPKDLSEGLDVCRVLHGRGIPSTLGRFSREGDDPEEIVREYRTASDAFRSSTAGDRFYLSLKPPALRFDAGHSMAIADTALRNGQGVHFDSHDHVLAGPTVRLLEQVMDRSAPTVDRAARWRFGLTLPARWKRSMADAEWAVERGVRARVTKGEFRSPGSSDETNPAAGFLALVDRLAGNVPEIALATHDCALAREAIRRCQGTGTSVQLELLFGMPVLRSLALSRETGVPVRIYVPYGDTLLVNGIRLILSNPRILLRPGFPELLAGHRSRLARIVGIP
jgi:proline dehydrogenase